MKHDVTLCRTKLSCNVHKLDITPAIPWLDLKISEYLDKCDDPVYINSREAKTDFAEIMGILKFFYVADILTKAELEMTVKYITGWRIYND